MTPKGADLEATDLLEVSTLESGSYVTRSITGQEIIDAASSGGGVTAVTGSAPIASTGGTTPDISIPQATTFDDGYLTSSDWSTFNNKQDGLISGTNIKTVNGSSVLGSGNLSVGTVTSVTATAPMASTGGATPVLSMDSATSSTDGYLNATDYVKFNNKLSGVHAIIPLVSGEAISSLVSGTAITGVNTLLNRLQTVPFIPNQSFTSANLYINISTFVVGANARILIYSNLDGKPDQKLYESANLDCSTNGIKTATTSFNFIAGETYWLTTHFSASAIIVSGHNTSSLMLIKNYGANLNATSYLLTATFGSAPTTFGTGTPVGNTTPGVYITVA